MARYKRAYPGHTYLHRGLSPPPLGLPQVTVPVVTWCKGPVRAWTGHGPVAGGISGPRPVTVPPVTLYRRPAPQIRRPAGTRVLWRGLAAQQLPAPVVTAYQRPSSRAARRPGARAWTGHGTAGGGIASPAPPPPSTTLGAQRCWITRSRPAARARTGGISASSPPGVTAYLTGVITTHNTDGTVTVWNITGTPAA